MSTFVARQQLAPSEALNIPVLNAPWAFTADSGSGGYWQHTLKTCRIQIRFYRNPAAGFVDGETLFTLPKKWWPARNTPIPGYGFGTVPGARVALLFINANGTVTYRTAGLALTEDAAFTGFWRIP